MKDLSATISRDTFQFFHDKAVTCLNPERTLHPPYLETTFIVLKRFKNCYFIDTIGPQRIYNDFPFITASANDGKKVYYRCI